MYVLANDVTWAKLVPRLNWKTKVYDMVSGKDCVSKNDEYKSVVEIIYINKYLKEKIHP